MGWRAPSKGSRAMQGGAPRFDRKLQEAVDFQPSYAALMTYRITGLDPTPFKRLFGLSDADLAEAGAIRMQVFGKPGFPCRITLEDKSPGETVLLVNHVSHDVANPYRASHAIFVTEGATEAASFTEEVPPVLDTRVLSLRGFDGVGMMVEAMLTQPGEAEAGIRKLFGNPEIAYIHAHNAARGCFAAKVERC